MNFYSLQPLARNDKECIQGCKAIVLGSSLCTSFHCIHFQLLFSGSSPHHIYTWICTWSHFFAFNYIKNTFATALFSSTPNECLCRKKNNEFGSRMQLQKACKLFFFSINVTNGALNSDDLLQVAKMSVQLQKSLINLIMRVSSLNERNYSY